MTGTVYTIRVEDRFVVQGEIVLIVPNNGLAYRIGDIVSDGKKQYKITGFCFPSRRPEIHVIKVEESNDASEPMD